MAFMTFPKPSIFLESYRSPFNILPGPQADDSKADRAIGVVYLGGGKQRK